MANRTISIADAKPLLHALIREGKPVDLVTRGVVVARLIPVKAGDRPATPPKEHATDTRPAPAPRPTRVPKPKPEPPHATTQASPSTDMQVDATRQARQHATSAQAKRDGWLRRMTKG